MKHRSRRLQLIILAFCIASMLACSNTPSSMPKGCATCPINTAVMYVTAPGQIFTFPLDPNSGALGTPTSMSWQITAGGITTTPSAQFLYAVDTPTHQIYGFAIQSGTGALNAIAGSPFPFPATPLATGELSTDPAGKYLYATDLFGSQVFVFQINGSTGALTSVLGSPFTSGFYPQKGLANPATKFLEVSDIGPGLGGISTYTIDPATGALTPGAGGALTWVSSAGANDIAMDSAGKYLYVAQGTLSSGGVDVLSLDPSTGFPTVVSGSPFLTGMSPARIILHPSGKFLYTANDGDGTISAFSTNSSTGMLTPVPGSPFSHEAAPPAGGLIFFDIETDPAGRFLYATNQQTNSIAIYGIDQSTGALSSATQTPLAAPILGTAHMLIVPLH